MGRVLLVVFSGGGVKFFKNSGLSGISDQNTPSSAPLNSQVPFQKLK